MVQRPPSVVRPLSVHVLVAIIIGGLVRPPSGWAAAPALVPRLCLTASGGPSIAVVTVGLDPRAAGQLGPLEAAAEGALTRSGRFTVVPVQDAANPAASRARKEKLAEARAKVREGRRALDDLDNIKATDALVEALAALRRTDLTRTFSELIDTWVLKAASHATGAETAPAKKDIEAVVALSPATELSATYFSSDLVKHGEAQRKLAGSARSELTIRTEPAGAQVWLDGTFRGGSPITIGGLPGARHVVSAALGGYQLAQAELGPGQELLKLEPGELGAAWRRAQASVASDPEGAGRDRAVVELGRQLGVDQVLLVEAKKSSTGDKLELVGLRLEVRDGHNAAWRTATLPEAGNGWGVFFGELASADTPRESGAALTHFHAVDAPSSRLVPSLALVGGGAVALVVGGVFGVLALNQSEQYHQTDQVKFLVSTQLKRDGQAYAVVADVSFILGIVAAATGGVLWFTGPKGSEVAATPPDLAGPREEPQPPQDTRRAPERATTLGSSPRAEPEKREDERKPRKLSRKQREEEEAQKADEARNRRDADQRAAEQREADRKAEERRSAERKPDEARRGEEGPRSGEAPKADEARKAPDEARKAPDDEKNPRDQGDRKKKKKDDDPDDLRNY